MYKPNHSLPESGEILRLILPLMSQYKIPVTPPNYAVWYEYMSGVNRQLKEKLDGFIRSGQLVNEVTTAALYNEFIDISHEIGQLEKAQQAFGTLHANISQVITTAYSNSSEFGDVLNGYQKRIAADINLEQLSLLIKDMHISTKQMVLESKRMMEDLAEARRESGELKKELIDMTRQVKTDSLTGLANRKAFFEHVMEMRVQGEFVTGRHSLLVIDIDHFKSVNDTYGHLFGDKVIKVVATVLKKYTQGKDLAVRFGGEEFVVLLPDTNIDGGRVVAEKIRRVIEGANITSSNNKQIVSKITVSIGIAEFGQDEDVELAINRADKAMYTGKENGRNQVVVA